MHPFETRSVVVVFLSPRKMEPILRTTVSLPNEGKRDEAQCTARKETAICCIAFDIR
jgi:hypothetical protein